MNSLLRPQQSTTSNGIFEIFKAHVPGWWIVKDGQGKMARVASQDLWRKGDRISVVDGKIVGQAGKEIQQSVYEV